MDFYLPIYLSIYLSIYIYTHTTFFLLIYLFNGFQFQELSKGFKIFVGPKTA